MNRIFEAQINNKYNIRQTNAKDRIAKLKKLNACIMKYSEEIQKAMYLDFKKPAEEVLLTEIYPTISEIKHTTKNLYRWMKDKRVKTPITLFGSRCKVKYESKGVSLIMSPWNFPFQLTIDPLASAIAAGNCVIIKPSEFSPATSALIKKMLGEIFEEKEVAVFLGDYTVSEELLKLPFDNIFFTGSPTVGKIVMSAAAKNLTTVTLELGGKSPVIITESADLNVAAKRVAWGKCLNAGQICVAPDYLFIPENKKEEFVRLMIKHIKEFYGSIDDGKADREVLKYCRIINKRHFMRIKGLIEEAVTKGAKIEFGGYYEEDDNLISPTILTEVSLECKVLEEEIFGPVLPIITYKNIDEVVTYINSKPKPLAVYIFSRDRKTDNYILGHVQSGDVLINDVLLHTINTELPFGGFNNSGIGKTHGLYGFKAFTHERSYLKQGKISTMSMFYPPFNDKTKKLIERFIKFSSHF